MKFDKIYPILILLIVTTSFVVGCASGPKKKEIGLSLDKSKPAVLVETTQYIPKRLTDEETGLLIPYQPAINPYSALKGRISSSSVSSYVSARQAFQNGETVRAKKVLEKLTIEDKSLSGPWVMLGDIAKLNKKYKDAIRHYARAIAVNKNNVNAYLRLAKLQRELGEFVRAQNTYMKALSIWQDFPEAHLNLAVLYDLFLNKPFKAQQHLEAYQFLTDGRDKKRADWLSEIQQRTGKAVTLKVETKKASSLVSS